MVLKFKMRYLGCALNRLDKLPKHFLFVIYSFAVCTSLAQSKHQVVRGSIKDNVSDQPIPFAKLTLLSLDPALSVLGDAQGNFRFMAVPTGTHHILVKSAGYDDFVLKGFVVDAGKETVLHIQMVEKIIINNEVTIMATRDAPINEMSVVSTNTFSAEETQRFAGALNDPARMVTAFAGVSSTGGFGNDISIRGNSPRGMIWRMEGVEIPNPNHFSGAGTSGGGISIISAQLMGTSDFSTGAFAAEYGNALSGVFDLGLRRGNNEKREYTFQASVIGLDAAIEGPFKKGYEGSYLLNYRYSTLALMTKVVPFRDNVTSFQDLSFNIFLPSKKIGNFGVFGFAGKSDDNLTAIKDSTQWLDSPERRYTAVFESGCFAVGLWHKLRVNDRAYVRSNAAFSGTLNAFYNDSLDLSYTIFPTYKERFIQTRGTISSMFVKKISSRTNFRLGLVYNKIGFQFGLQRRIENLMRDLIDESGSTATLQSFVQVTHKFNDKFTVNVGVHYLQLMLNNSWSVEPRTSVNFKVDNKNSLAFAYGLHSQIQPLGTYFAREPESSEQPNTNLDLSKAHHWVFSYKRTFNENHRLRAELYYQYLSALPIGVVEDSTYSLINSPGGYEAFPLVSQGVARNYGLELTFERTLSNNFYYLISTSLFDSKYRAFNGSWYNTRYNMRYIFNLNGGKDWEFKNSQKRRTLSVNFKSTLAGGMRFTNLNSNNLDINGYPQFDYARSFENQMPAFYKLDIRIGLKRNYEKATGMVYIDLLNALNNKNPAGQFFDPQTGEVNYFYHFGITPVFGYRLSF